MKKILSILLTITLSLFVVGTTDLLKAEATSDVTIFLHIHQYDGNYANTGTGVWDGVNWNDFGDVADPALQDGFGAVIKLDYTAAEINAVSDQIEFKPTRDVNNDDNVLDGGLAANSNYLAPDSVEGKVMADVTALKDGSVTELNLYYVEGAKDFYVVQGAPTDGLFFNVFTNPEVAADETVYDGWGMHTWNNGMPDIDWGENPNQYAIEMELESSVGWIPARLGVIKVADGNVGNAGFIAHKGDTKSCPQDMFFDTDELLALDGKAQVALYEFGACEFATDYNTYISDVATKFEMNSGNRLVAGTQIVDPSTMDVQMLMPKVPEDLLKDRFGLQDGNGNQIAIEDIQYPVLALGSYKSDVELRTETHVIVFVNTDLDASHVALVGNIQGWAPDTNPILTTGQDINGYDVFEFTTFEQTAEFKFLYDETDSFNWGDTELIGSNIVVDLSAGGTIEVFFDDATDTYSVVDATPAVVDTNDYTYTSAVTCNAGENLFTLFLDTELDSSKIGLVGSIQEATPWSPENAITASGVTAEGYVVFETCVTGTNFEYKVLYDNDDNGFNWGDRELVQNNTVVDFGDGTIDGNIAHLINGPITVLGDYVPTMSATSIYRLSVYMAGDVDWNKVGIVGTMNGWDVVNSITYKEMDAFGNAIFDIPVNEKTGEYLIVYDVNDNGFNWDDKISGNDNLTFDLGEGATLVQSVFIDDANGLTFDNSAWNASYGGATTSTSSIIDGSLVVDVNWDSAPATTDEIQINQDGFAVENNKFYRITFDAKADMAKDILVAFGDALDADPWFTEFAPKTTVTLGTDWNTYTIEFQMTEPTTADQGELVFELATDGQTKVYLDNVKFEEIDALGGNVVTDTDQVLDGTFYSPVKAANMTTIGATIDDIVTNMVTIKVAADTFAFDGNYTLSYLEEYVPVADTTTLPSDLFISEYIEGGGNNKALEIYNPTGADVDLTPYSIQENYGSGTNTYDLTGTLAAGDVLVLCTDQIDPGTNLEANCDIQFAYPSVVHFNGDDTIELLKDGTVIDQIGDEALAGGDDYAKDVTLVRNETVFAGNTTFDMNEWMSFPKNTFDYIGAHDFAPVEPSYITFENVPVILSNNFVPGDVVAATGTYADTPTSIMVQFENPTQPMTDLALLDANNEAVSFESYGNMYGLGDYTATKTCDAGEQLIFVHINVMNTDVTDLSQLGIVGTINGWDVANSITASGQDANGNYVFEVCLAGDVTNGEFKVKFDADSDGFTWDGVADPELTPSNVAFTVADGPDFYVEEGTGMLDASALQVITLSDDNMLDKTSSYTLQFTDAAGFVVSIPVLMDNEAPVIQATVKPGVAIVFDGYSETFADFDLFDYFDILTFVDTRDGDLGFNIEQAFNPNMVGMQKMYISATDSWGNKAVFGIDVDVVYNDVDAPTITGEDSITLTVGDDMPDWESYVTISDGTLTVDTSQVDITSDGTFYVIYTATDQAGNTSTHSMQVTVNPAPAEETEPDTGCFGALNIASTLILSIVVLGGAAVLVVRKR